MASSQPISGNVVALRPPLTREDIYKRKMVNAMHIDYSRKESAWIGDVEGVPRLSVNQHRGQKCVNTWYVDKQAMPSLDAALDVLNGVKTLEEAAQVIPAEAQRPGRVSIEAQIAEIDYELKQREKVYPRIAASDPAKGRENELHVERMKAVRATLVWLQANEAAIKQRMSY